MNPAPKGNQDQPGGPNPRVVSDSMRWKILIVLLSAMFMSLIGVSIVNVALPSIQRGLGASQSDIQWVLSGYALTFGVILVAAGRAGDILGRGGIFLVGVGLFTASSVAAGLAPDADWLNGARFVQGLGSGLLNPQGMGMIQHYFRGEERARAFGYLGVTVGVSVAIGPVLGGILIAFGGPDIGWRLTFLVNLPVGLAVLVLGFLWFPKPLIDNATRQTAGTAGAANRAGRAGTAMQTLMLLDPVGSILLGAAMLAILFPFVEARGSPAMWLLLLLGVVLVYFWVLWERRYLRLGRSPMVDLNIFSTSSFANGTLIMTLYFLGMTSIWVLVALYVQEGDGRTALESGFFGIPSALLSAYAAHWAGKRVMRLGRRVVIGGLATGVFGLALSIGVVLLHEQGYVSIWWLLLSLSFVGIAQGAVISPNQTLTLMEVPLSYAGSSGAVMQTGQRIGTSVGIAVITAAVFASLEISSWATAVSAGFGLIGLVILSALGVAFKDLRDRKKHV